MLPRSPDGPMKPAVCQLLMRNRGRALTSFPPSAYRGDTAAAALSIATPDGANELTHPSIYDAGEGNTWNGFRYWMAATPYAASNTAIENPCIYRSSDLSTWAAPAGLVNPITPTPGGSAFNSDTHLVMGFDNNLYCFYREFNTLNVGSEERIYYKKSADGSTWGSAVLSLSTDQTVARYVSPAINWDGSQWVMYAVDIVPSPNTIVRLTASSLAGPWSSPRVCSASFSSGREAWHLDAKYISGVWYLLVQDTATGGSSGGGLYLLKGSDPLTFVRTTPLVVGNLGNWHDLTYRSCLVPKTVSGKLAFDVLYSGISPAGNYFLGKTQVLWFDEANYATEPSMAIAGAVANTAPYILGDDFSRADGAIGTSAGGEVWTNSAGSPVVVSRQAGAGSAVNTRAYLDAATATFYVEASLTNATTADQTWLVFRLSDDLNYWRVGFNATSFALQKIVAGAATTLSTATVAQMGDMPTSGTRVGVICSGNTLTVKLEGRTWFSASDVFNNTATKCGFQCNNTRSRIGNFFVRSLVGGA